MRCNIAGYERYHGQPCLEGISARIDQSLDPRARYENENDVVIERDCEECGAYMALTKLKQGQRFCTIACRDEAQKRRRKA